MPEIYSLTVSKSHRSPLREAVYRTFYTGTPCWICGRPTKPVCDQDTDDEGNVTYHVHQGGLPAYWRAKLGFPKEPDALFCSARCGFLDYEKRRASGRNLGSY